MKILSIVLLVAMVQLLPVTLHACDCGCTCQPLFHFKDGITPNGPVTAETVYADSACYKDTYGFRDYGPAHVTPPPATDTKEMKHPSS